MRFASDGHVEHFCLWTKSVSRFNNPCGTQHNATSLKNNYSLPHTKQSKQILAEDFESFLSTIQKDSRRSSEELTEEPENYVEAKFIHKYVQGVNALFISQSNKNQEFFPVLTSSFFNSASIFPSFKYQPLAIRGIYYN